MLLLKMQKFTLYYQSLYALLQLFALKYAPLYILTNKLSKKTVSKPSSDLESLMSNIYEKNLCFIIKLGKYKSMVAIFELADIMALFFTLVVLVSTSYLKLSSFFRFLVGNHIYIESLPKKAEVYL